jgi:uncharacterized protein YjbI with pentapeptide repeats
LGGSNLERAKLNQANLERARLHQTQLRGAELIETNLRRTNLTRANLDQANLREANLEEANLRAEFKRERQIDELKRQIEEISQQQPASIGDRLFALLDQHGETIFGNLLGKGAQQQLRTPGGVNGIPEEEDETETATAASFSVDKMLYDLGQIQQALPDVNAQEMLHRLAMKAMKDPDTLRNALQYL